MNGNMDKNIAGIDTSVQCSTRTQLLEAKYIELLEKRIATLEALVIVESPVAPNKSTTTEQNIALALKGKVPIQSVLRDNDITSPIAEQQPASKIAFRERRVNKEGIEFVKSVSEEEPQLPEQPQRSKEQPELIWFRIFNEKDKYVGSEVKVESVELRALLQVKFSHDPRFHSLPESIKNTITLNSPFELLVHHWGDLEVLSNANYDSLERSGLKSRLSDVRPRSDTANHTPDSSALLVLANKEKATKAMAELKILLEHARLTPELKSYFPGIDAETQSRSIRFDYLWTIFPPGEIVYSTLFMKKPQLFIVKESGAEISTQSDSGKEKDMRRVWYLVCWSYDWNGRTFNRVPVLFKFDDFQGFRDISTLQCHPLRYHSAGADGTDIEVLRKKLSERGKRFRKLCTAKIGHQMFDYDGDAISHGAGFQFSKNAQNEDDDGSFGLAAMLLGRRRRPLRTTLVNSQTKTQRKSGRVIVDFGSYLQQAPNVARYGPMGDGVFSNRDDECRCASCTSNEALRENQKTGYDNYGTEHEFVDDVQYQICPPRVLGYHLGTRTWLELDIDKIQDIKGAKSREAFDKLELVKAQKELIRNLVESHTSGTAKEQMMIDIMKDKGNGLVILLHGPPGVGKTLTAESVAQLAGKPLFSVGPSDIGLNPTEVEQNLEALFELAARWRAVLLFDEADVFLESRSSHTSDLTRNALVSVLLRVLEYYSGILILTTNRIQQFDIAVQSRVNLGIRYKDLSMEQKKKIFNNFIDQIPDEKIDDKEGLKNLMDEDTDSAEWSEWFEALNGRQVRNVLFSAASLAMKDGEVLKKKHIKSMVKSTWQFQDSLKGIVQEARRKAEIGRD